nr:hypothetical protein [Tanacetum cinerariifolium]
MYQIEYKKQKKGIEMHQDTQQYGAILPIKLTNEDIRNTTTYKEYYAYATGVAAPKPKASAKKKRGDFDTSLTPPIATPTITAAPVPRLSAAAKGKRHARAATHTEPTDVERTEAEQLKIVLRRSRQEKHISQQRGSGIDKGTGDKNDESDDGSDDGNDDDNDETVKDGSERDDADDDNDDEEELAKIDEPEDTESSRGGDEVTESEGEIDEEETRQEEKESFDPIPRTPEGSEDEGSDEEDQDLRLSEEARIQEDDAGVESIFTTASSLIVSLQIPTPIMTPSTIATITTSSDAPIPLTTIQRTILENLPTFDSVFRFDKRLKSLETTFSEYRQTNPFVDAVVPGQSFAELPFEEEILEFLRFLGHSAQIKTLTDVNVVSRHQNTQQYGVILPIELTTEDIRNTKAYKEYYACATREAAPKPKASARKKRGGSDSSTTPLTAVASPRPITTVAAALRLTAADKGKQPARATSPTKPLEVERTEVEQLKIVLRRSRQEMHISQHGGFSTDERTDVDDQTKGRDDNEGEKTDESDADDEDQDETEKDDDDNDEDDEEEIAKLDGQEDTESGEGDAEETKSDRESEEKETREEEEESFDPIPRTLEDDEDDDNGDEDQGLRISEEERIQEEEEADELYRVESIFTTASSPIAPLLTPTPSMTPSTIATITTTSEAPIPPTTFPSAVLENLLTFDSVFRFEDRVKSLEVNFSEFMQTDQFAEAVSKILGIVHQYMTQQMTEAVREAVQIQTDRIQDSFQRENDEFLRTIDENMKKIIKGQVKSQVKEQVSRILPRIEEFVNAQLEAEVLTRSSNSSRTSYAVDADLTEMELKKILIEKMKGNKSIQRSDEQRNMYKALVDAYEADKTILESYGDTAILKRRRGDDDDQEGPSAGSDRGSKRRREGGEHESASTPSEPATKSRMGLCTSLTELEYHLEEVYKATTDQLDWVNPEGVSHWGRKRQQFYGFTVNRESALDVYSKRRIIAVTDLKIVEW